jgi:hypothetical protein
MNMPSTKPMEISTQEWREIMNMPEVSQDWGITDESPEEFAETVYGVKFHFVSGGPGYVGDLYIIQGMFLTGDPPYVIGRENGKLTLFNQDNED